MATNNTPTATGVDIVLDKKRRLSYDFFACWSAERAYADRFNEKKITPFIDLVFEGTYGGLICALWAGLLKDDPKLTLEQVNNMLRPRQMNDISTLVIKATLDQVVAPEEDSEKEEQVEEKKTTGKAAKTDGASSQPSDVST